MSQRRIRVLIVDDSAMVRKMLTIALANEADIEIVGTAPDPYVAREKVIALEPDVITLDIEMPRMDGITFLRKLMVYKPLPVIVISSVGHASCQAGLEALRAGAVEILAKPNGPYSVGELGATLASKIRMAAQARVRPLSLGQSANAATGLSLDSVGGSVVALPPQASLSLRAQRRILAIGASTGGPQAVAEILQEMPADSPPILVTQHMPPVFTAHFAARLDRLCRISVKEAVDGDAVLPGHALIAPGSLHMALQKIDGQYRVRVAEGPPVCFSRPSIDVLFFSVAEVAGKDAIGVLLTGMGADGARGLLKMRTRGCHTIAQDEESSVVFGMPKEAIRIGAAAVVLPLGQISGSLGCLLREDPANTLSAALR